MDSLFAMPVENDEITSICNSNFQFHLLFKKKPQRPSADRLVKVLSERFGKVSVTMDSEELSVYSLEEVVNPNLEGRLKVKVIMTDLFPIEKEEIWMKLPDQAQNEELKNELGKMQYCMLITDMLASSLSCSKRCDVLVGWLRSILTVFDEVDAVWIPSARKVLMADQLKNCTEKEILEKLFLGITVQVFSTEEKKKFLVITRGMEVIKMKNYVYIFRGINREVAIEYAYQMASNLLENGQILEAFEDFDRIQYDKIPPCDTKSRSLIRVFSI